MEKVRKKLRKIPYAAIDIKTDYAIACVRQYYDNSFINSVDRGPMVGQTWLGYALRASDATVEQFQNAQSAFLRVRIDIFFTFS